jgi:polyphosphate kinase 2
VGARKKAKPQSLSKKDYKKLLRGLQIELVKLQHQVIERGDRILILFEGRDAAGKDGTIKRIVEHLSPRETRVVAPGKPSDRDRGSWYFQRFVPHLPAAQEIVLFNRSWYNRAGVERVMGFCTPDECDEFLAVVPDFERMLVRSGTVLMKFYLDISKAEQAKRLAERREDPLKQWKISPIDDVALERWDDYSQARDAMLAATHQEFAPWTVVQADEKKAARIHLIRDLLARVDYARKDPELAPPDPGVVMRYERGRIEDRLAP